MTLLKHEVLMHRTIVSTGTAPIAAIFEAESGARFQMTEDVYEDFGSPQVIHVTVEPGPIPEPEPKASDDSSFNPLNFLREALGREYVDRVLAELGLFPSDRRGEAEALLSAVDTIKQTGGAVEIAGVRIEPCDTYGQTETTLELEALRRYIQIRSGSRSLGPVVISRDEMPSIDVRNNDSLAIDTTNISYIFLLESSRLEEFEPEVTELTAEIDSTNGSSEGKTEFEQTAEIAIRNLRQIVADTSADDSTRLRAAELILSYLYE